MDYPFETSASNVSPSVRPLPRLSCRPGDTLVRVPTNPVMPCAGVEDDATRQMLREPGALWLTAALPIAFAAAALVSAFAT